MIQIREKLENPDPSSSKTNLNFCLLDFSMLSDIFLGCFPYMVKWFDISHLEVCMILDLIVLKMSTYWLYFVCSFRYLNHWIRGWKLFHGFIFYVKLAKYKFIYSNLHPPLNQGLMQLIIHEICNIYWKVTLYNLKCQVQRITPWNRINKQKLCGFDLSISLKSFFCQF